MSEDKLRGKKITELRKILNDLGFSINVTYAHWRFAYMAHVSVELNRGEWTFEGHAKTKLTALKRAMRLIDDES